MIVRLAVCLLVLVPSAAVAEVCERARLDLPEPVADAVRPYVICAMFSGDGTTFSTDGSRVDAVIQQPFGGLGRDACATVRAKAALEASQDLQVSMPDRDAREQYIESVLQDADRFIAALESSHAVGIDPPERLAACTSDQEGSAQ
jgi:hypothetical protein